MRKPRNGMTSAVLGRRTAQGASVTRARTDGGMQCFTRNFPVDFLLLFLRLFHCLPKQLALDLESVLLLVNLLQCAVACHATIDAGRYGAL